MHWTLHQTGHTDPFLTHMDPPDHIPVLDRSLIDDTETLQDLAYELGCPLNLR
jgi:hypothetical protein